MPNLVPYDKFQPWIMEKAWEYLMTTLLRQRQGGGRWVLFSSRLQGRGMRVHNDGLLTINKGNINGKGSDKANN